MSELKKLSEAIREVHTLNTPPGGMGYMIDSALLALADDIDIMLTAEKFVTGREQFEATAEGERKAEVLHFAESGKYKYTDYWRIPEKCLTPHDMKDSPDFRDIGMTIVVPTQEPWGFPAVLKTVPMPEYPEYVPLTAHGSQASQ